MYAYRNPYGVELISETQEKAALADYYRSGGCLDQIKKCRQLQRELDPNDYGNNYMVNKACMDATLYCDKKIRDVVRYGRADRFAIHLGALTDSWEY